MKKWFLGLLMLVCLFLLLSQYAFAKIQLKPGEGFDDLKLGETSSAYILRKYGNPDLTQKTGGIEYFFYFDKYKLVFTIDNSSKNLVEIITYDPFYLLPDGTTIGTPKQEIMSKYKNSKIDVVQGDTLMTVPDLGITFVFRNDTVFAISIGAENYKTKGIPVPKK